MKTFSLENSELRADFDLDTGAIIGLTNKKTGWAMNRRPELGVSFIMLCPMEGRRNNLVLGGRQKPPKVDRAKDGKRVTFTWSGLASEHAGVLDITFAGAVTISDEGLRFTGTIDNKSELAVENLNWPVLGDISVPADRKLWQLSKGYGTGNITELSPNFINHKGYWGVDYPTQMVAAPESMFIMIQGTGQGLYVGYHDETLRESVQFKFELKPGWETMADWSGTVPQGDNFAGRPAHIEFATVHMPFVAPGASFELSPIVMQAFTGDWHKGADIYKKWYSTWYKPLPAPAWAKDVHSWHQLHINSPEDELRCRYKDLVKYGEDCARHGVKAIQLVGWNNGGQDGGNPSHDIDPRLGAWQELKDAIAKIEGLGVRVILFNKYAWADRSTKRFRDELVKLALTDPYGDYYMHGGYQYQTTTQLADINTRRLVPMCHNAPKWRQIACKEFQKSIDLGASGMLFDETRNHAGRYCFNPDHGHAVPAHAFAGDHKLSRDFHKLSDPQKSDYLYAGEDFYDVLNLYYHLSYFRAKPAWHIPLARYVDPRIEMMIAVVGFDDRPMINHALQCRYIISYEPFNFKGRLDDFPLNLAYGKKIDDLRRRYREFLWDGQFQDTVGAKVSAGKEDHKHYSVFRHADKDKYAVVVCNHGKDALQATVQLDGRNASWVMASPENPQAIACEGTVTIGPLCAAVLMEQ